MMNVSETAATNPVESPESNRPYVLPIFAPESIADGWAKPLEQAFIRTVLAPDTAWMQRVGVHVTTGWDPAHASRLEGTDPEKHGAYAQYIVDAVASAHPREFYLLQVTGATLSAFPSFCGYKLPQVEAVYPIPPMVPFTEFLPWLTHEDLSSPVQ